MKKSASENNLSHSNNLFFLYFNLLGIIVVKMGSGNGTAFELAEYEKKNGVPHGKQRPRGKQNIFFMFLLVM